MPRKPKTFATKAPATTPAPELSLAEMVAEVVRMKADGAKLYRAAGQLERLCCSKLGKSGSVELADGRRFVCRDLFAHGPLAKKEVYISRYELELVEE